MRILVVSPVNLDSNYGGAQVYLRNLLNEFIRKGVQTFVVTLNQEVSSVTYYKNISVYSFNLNISDFRIKELLTSLNLDLIHLHGFKAIFSKIGYELGIPVVITAHHGGILCPAGTLLNHRDEICHVRAEFKNCLPCVLKNVRCGAHAFPLVNKIPQRTYEGIGKYLEKKPFVPYISPVLGVAKSIKKKENDWDEIVRYSSLMIAPSYAIALSVEKNGYPKDQIKVIPHGIPLPKSDYPKSKNSSRPQLFYLGRINRVKGIHVLLEAIQGIEKDFDLHIFGNAVTREEKRYLTSLKKQSRRDLRVHWKGGIPYDQVFESIQSMDLMIHSTICMEVFGLNIAETLALGIPVIATRCGGAEMQIRDGENGILVAPNDVNELRTAILKFLNYPSAYEVDASKVVSIEDHANKLIDIYASLVD